MFGGDGDDTLSADPYLPSDRSRLHGEAGNDTLVAGSANDARTELYGGEGDDRLVGHPGARLDGGAGSDRHVLWGGATGAAIGVAFARGSERDSITFGAEESGVASDVRFEVRLPEGNYRDLVVERDGEDLVLRIRDRDDRIAVPDFFAEGAARSGMTQLALVQAGTGLVLAGSPDAEAIAARAVAVPAEAQLWTGNCRRGDPRRCRRQRRVRGRCQATTSSTACRATMLSRAATATTCFSGGADTTRSTAATARTVSKAGAATICSQAARATTASPTRMATTWRKAATGTT